MKYCTIEDIQNLTGVEPNQWFKNSEVSDEKFEVMLNDWITKASFLINDYCKQEWSDVGEVSPESPPPVPVKLACSLIVTNLVTFAQKRREVGLIRRDDWNKYVSDDNSIFDDHIKSLLRKYVKAGGGTGGTGKFRVFSVSRRETVE